MDARIPLPGIRKWAACLLLAAGLWLAISSDARAGVDGQCPSIADKPGAVPHVDYPGIEHHTYCYGPIQIHPGQNIIRLNPATDSNGKLFPQVPGYITRFDPDLVYTDGSVPGVDVLHLHHAVWLVNGNPQFAAGEEKTIEQMPLGFGWHSNPGDSWLLNDMLHELVAKPATVYLVWRVDFVPDSVLPSIKTVHTQWMDVAGNPSLYPVFDALRADGQGGTYTFPDQAPAADLHPCSLFGRAPDAHGCLGAAQTWTPNAGETLIGTVGHLHPGGLNTQLRVTRGSQTNTLFTSNAHYYEPAGAVSWDVAMGGTPSNWMVKLQAGDKLSVHATYDTSRADWYEVMGIMPVAVYNGTDVGGLDAMSPSIPQNEVLNHGHLRENDNHGASPTNLPDPLKLPGFPTSSAQVDIQGYSYLSSPDGAFTRRPPTILRGQTLKFKNFDAAASINSFHTITACKAPCNGSTGIAYPVANGPVTFDSGELGFNGNNGGLPSAPAADRDSWTVPTNLKAGTYTYFCRIHPFMRGSFRIAGSVSCHGKTATMVGTEGRDVLRGTKKRDVIVGLGGNDKIIGLGGNDVICGGPGKDKIMGGKGKDKLYGDAGKDRLIGGPGVDRVVGGAGLDRVIGGAGVDKVIGRSGQRHKKH